MDSNLMIILKTMPRSPLREIEKIFMWRTAVQTTGKRHPRDLLIGREIKGQDSLVCKIIQNTKSRPTLISRDICNEMV